MSVNNDKNFTVGHFTSNIEKPSTLIPNVVDSSVIRGGAKFVQTDLTTIDSAKILGNLSQKHPPISEYKKDCSILEELSLIELLLKNLEECPNVKIEEGHEDDKEKIYVIYVAKQK